MRESSGQNKITIEKYLNNSSHFCETSIYTVKKMNEVRANMGIFKLLICIKKIHIKSKQFKLGKDSFINETI